ncbi:DUF4928 family protein [Micrococcus luteus]|uniref:DUF4928 family protein n=1 Tax=Micrococcus luteus TaxID=1270 RepID=UPI0020CBD244|nr:DUF4928 family protein [Micrococcus luteus]UTT45421.1 DUF4928 family protein [Micrococcus luteus]
MSADSVWAELEPRLTDWFERQRKPSGSMNTNVMTAGLIVAHKAADGLPITEERLSSNGGSQVRGLSGACVSELLREHGENRRFTSEGGRTSRGTIVTARGLNDLLTSFVLEHPEAATLNVDLAFRAEEYFVRHLQVEYFDKQTIEVEINPDRPVSVAVSRILDAAKLRADNPSGAVLQHLVGAKLELRFPDEEIGRDQATTADDQTDRQGDFQVGTTAFHVTMAPMEKLIQRCRTNLASGFRPVIITPENKVMAARQMAETYDLGERLDVLSAQVFIGTNIEEIGVYDGDAIRRHLGRLLTRYNDRIAAIEVDQSLRIDLPSWAKAAHP